MPLTLFKWNGTIIRVGGNMARDAACCCGASGGRVVCCCPDKTLPDTLLATFSDKTGDCACLPDTLLLNYTGSDPDAGVDGEWFGLYTECDECYMTLRCFNCEWEITTASCTHVDTTESVSCDPFILVFLADNSIGGNTNCTGTYKVTITIP